MNLKAQLDNQAQIARNAEAAKALVEQLVTAGTNAGAIKARYDEGTKALTLQTSEAKTLAAQLRAGLAAANFETDKGTAGLFGKSAIRDSVLAMVDELEKGFAGAGTEAGDKLVADMVKAIYAKLDANSNFIRGKLSESMAVADADGNIAKSINGVLDEYRRKAIEFSKTKVQLGFEVTGYAAAQKKVDDLVAEMKNIPELMKFFPAVATSAGIGIADGLVPAQREMKALDANIMSVIKHFQNLQTAKRNAATPTGKVTVPEEHARGGMIGMFASGGFMDDFMSGKYASGTDRIPIMASRGEYMVNAAATRQFLPLLRAINSGKFTPGRSGGGNTTVGDINVSVKGGSTSEATVKGIADGLRRGLRTGTIRLGTNNNTINS